MRDFFASPQPGGRWRFGVFDFDARTLELWKSGRIIKVRPQSLKLLTILLSRPGELVSRSELQRGVWGAETFVDFEQGVNHCIKELRAALGDSADSPRYIETLARRGYRFIAPVESIPAGGAEAAVSDAGIDATSSVPTARWSARAGLAVLILGLTVTAVVAVPYLRNASSSEMRRMDSVVVLPFVTDPGDPTLGVGLANAIARRLGGQQHVTIQGVGNAGANEYEARENRAGFVLDGEMRTQGATLVVLARLKDVARDAVVWSERFRVRADELFSVEDVVAERVANAMELRLAAGEQERLRRRYTQDTVAYGEYLRGRAALVRYTPEGTLEAIAAFERALQRDANYALARAGLAMACADMCLRFAPNRDVDRWAERTEAEARLALDLDPDLAEAHLARAAVARKREFDWALTMDASRRALALNPNLDQARFFMAAAYYHLGYMEEALIEMQKGRALDAGDVVEPSRIEGLVALFSGNFAPALVRLTEVSRLSSQPIGDTYLALAAYYTGSAERARAMLETLATHPTAATAQRSGAVLAGLLAASGETNAARAQLDRVLASPYRDHHVAYSIGVAHAQLGNLDEAWRWLRTAADTGFPCLPWFERDPLLEPARQSPAFQSLLKYVRERRDSTLTMGY